MQSLRHPNIVRARGRWRGGQPRGPPGLKVLSPRQIQLLECCETPHRAYLILEYAAGGDLLEFINSRGALPDDLSRRLFRQIALAVDHCHGRHIIHRSVQRPVLAGVAAATAAGAASPRSRRLAQGSQVREHSPRRQGQHQNLRCGAGWFNRVRLPHPRGGSRAGVHGGLQTLDLPRWWRTRRAPTSSWPPTAARTPTRPRKSSRARPTTARPPMSGACGSCLSG